MHRSHSKRLIWVWVIVIIGVALAWLASGYVLVPELVAKAYRGESLAIFNKLISGQANHALSEYLADWHRLANKLSFALGVLDVFVLLAVFGWNASEAAGRDSVDIKMPKVRLFVVYGLGAIIFGGALSDLVRDTEHWPFAQYSMFSETEMSTKTYSMFRLYGVLDGSPLVELPLDSDLYLQPFDNSRLTPALEHAAKINRLDEAVTNCLVRYDALRRARRHNGPPLVAMRLYRVTWTIEPSAENVDQPDHKELWAEVREPYERRN